MGMLCVYALCGGPIGFVQTKENDEDFAGAEKNIKRKKVLV